MYSEVHVNVLVEEKGTCYQEEESVELLVDFLEIWGRMPEEMGAEQLVDTLSWKMMVSCLCHCGDACLPLETIISIMSTLLDPLSMEEATVVEDAEIADNIWVMDPKEEALNFVQMNSLEDSV